MSLFHSLNVCIHLFGTPVCIVWFSLRFILTLLLTDMTTLIRINTGHNILSDM